jgi:DNA-binding NtrC family response regulator
MGRRDVLLLDDDVMALETMCLLLRRHHHIRTCADAAAARRQVELSPPDVLLTDFFLDGDTSEDLLGRLRGSHPGVRRIVLTGSWPAADYLARTGLADEVVVKPTSIARLLAALDKSVAQPAGLLAL